MLEPVVHRPVDNSWVPLTSCPPFILRMLINDELKWNPEPTDLDDAYSIQKSIASKLLNEKG